MSTSLEFRILTLSQVRTIITEMFADGTMTEDDVLIAVAIESAVLDALTGSYCEQPVAWKVGLELYPTFEQAARNVRNPDLAPIPLFTKALVSAPLRTAPGFQAVPVEPSLEMITELGFAGDVDIAIGHAALSQTMIERYRNALKVAPAQPDPTVIQVPALDTHARARVDATVRSRAAHLGQHLSSILSRKS